MTARRGARTVGALVGARRVRGRGAGQGQNAGSGDNRRGDTEQTERVRRTGEAAHISLLSDAVASGDIDESGAQCER